MTADNLLANYAKMLEDGGYEPVQAAEYIMMNTPQEALKHAMWMSIEATLFPPHKKLRWLCCVQGILFTAGLVSIAELRRDTSAILERHEE